MSTDQHPPIVEQNLAICVRMRPMSKDEIRQKASKICHRVNEKLISLVDPLEDNDHGFRSKRNRNREYTFDFAFDESCKQAEVFEHTTHSLIDHVANGFNATVFASGATGAGKTHTMVGTDKDPGIMVRAMQGLFDYAKQTSDDYHYRITMGYMELYNELLRDLLMPGPDYLELREDSRGVQVIGLSEMEPSNQEEIFELLHRGNLNRTTEPTAANETSSRSHAILQITVHQSSRVASINQQVRVGKLFLIDLAGSERASKTLNRGKRMTEGAHINRSLLALGNCINALTDTNNQNGKRYVNYRDSKLTRLLKDALAGNCRTVMVAHISPSSCHFEETCNTLVYADRAKSIKTKVRRNVHEVNHHISQYTRLIDELRGEIGRLKTNLTQSPNDKELDPDATEVNNFEEELLTAYQDHLNIRRELVQVKNRLLELDLEETNQSEWDSSRASIVSFPLAMESPNTPLDTPQNEESNGNGILGKQERAALQTERIQLETSQSLLAKDQKAAADKVAALQKSLLERQMRVEEREILHLLERLHELELERADLDARYALSGTELKRRECLLDQLRMDSRVSEMIIRYQADLLANHNVETPKELEQLLEIYEQQANPARLRRISVGSSVTDVRPTNHLKTGLALSNMSTSLSCLPMESAFEGNPQLRTASWLEAGAPRRASCTDAQALNNRLDGDTGAMNLDPTLPPQRVKVPVGRARTGSTNVLLPGNARAQDSQYQPNLTTQVPDYSYPNPPKGPDSGSLGNGKLSYEEPQDMTNSDCTTKTISRVAQQRRDQKIREARLKQRSSVTGNTTKDNASTLSDIGEMREHHQEGMSTAPHFPFPPIPVALTPTNETVRTHPRRPKRMSKEEFSTFGDADGGPRYIYHTPPNTRPPSQNQMQSDWKNTGDRELIDSQDAWMYGPLTRPIKVIPVDLKSYARPAASYKVTRARLGAGKSAIPRSRSTPRVAKSVLPPQGQNLDDVQTDEVVKTSDQCLHRQEPRRAIISNVTRRPLGYMPLQQKTAVDRRNQRILQMASQK